MRTAPLLLVLPPLALGLGGCRVEPGDGDPLVTVTRTDTTLAGGAYDFPPGAPRFPAADAAALPRPADSLPNPRPVNPPAVGVEGAPPAPEAAEPAAGLLIPVAGVGPAELADTYTDARGQGRVHNAIDIMAPRGTPVLAAAAGEVLRLFESERGGLTVYQRGPDGRSVYYYAHLDAYAPGLAAGQRVARGDTLGTVGDSGNAAPGNTHLHFAVWLPERDDWFWDGEPVNPYPLLVGEPSAGRPPSEP